MKVVQVTRRFVRRAWGGVETSVLESCKRLRAWGHDVEIECTSALAESSAWHRDEMETVPIARHPYFYPYWGLTAAAREALDHKGGNLFSLSLWRALTRSDGVSVLHAHSTNRLGGIVRHVARQRRIPYVVSIHGGILDLPETQRRRLLAPTRGAWEWGRGLGWWVGSRRVLRDASAIICFGRDEYERIRQAHPRSRVRYMPHGVDSERFARGEGRRFREHCKVPAGRQIILTVARIDPQKNQLLAVESLPRLLAAAPEAHLVLCGPVTCPDYARRLQASAARSGCGDRLTILEGLPPDSQLLVDAYHAADLFLLSSMHEAFGIVLLEAWAAGAPVVASNIGGVRSLVRHEVDGLLFRSGDSCGLVRQASRVLSARPLREALAKEAAARVRREFDWNPVTQRLLSIYEEVAHGE